MKVVCQKGLNCDIVQPEQSIVLRINRKSIRCCVVCHRCCCLINETALEGCLVGQSTAQSVLEWESRDRECRVGEREWGQQTLSIECVLGACGERNCVNCHEKRIKTGVHDSEFECLGDTFRSHKTSCASHSHSVDFKLG